jgi:DNA-binding NarL/FixJ family response regulator
MAVVRRVDGATTGSLGAAVELLESGAPFQAIRSLRGLADISTDPGIRLCLASAFIELGRDVEAAPIVEGLLADRDDLGPQRAMVLATAAHLRSVLGDPDDARRLARLAIDAGGGTGEAAALGLLAVSRGYMFDGDMRRGLRWAHRATEAAASARPRALAKTRIHEAYLLMHNDRFDDAERVAASTADVPGADNARIAALRRIVLGAIRFHAGRWAGTDRLLDPRPDVDAGVEIGDQEWATSAGILAVLLVHADRIDEAAELVTQGAHVLATGQRPMLLWGGLLLADARGDVGLTALMADRLIAGLEGLRSLGRLRFVGPDLVRILVGLDDRRRATAVTLALERVARDAIPSVVAVAALCRGILDREADALQAAAIEFARAGRPLEQATALETLAIDASTGSSDAATSGRAALALYERIGARRDASRLASALRGRGIASGRRGPRSRSTVGWASLTPTEQQVARLVTEGLTNAGVATRLGISDRTVETHVSHILNKLALPGRAAIAATAARLGEDA